jgi:hypothetical protein
VISAQVREGDLGAYKRGALQVAPDGDVTAKYFWPEKPQRFEDLFSGRTRPAIRLSIIVINFTN